MLIATTAVSAATYSIDRPYDYRVPENLTELVAPGKRVRVPFSNSNRVVDAIVLRVDERTEENQLKDILSVQDKDPVLSPLHIQLGIFLSTYCFCTVFSALKAMLPAGLWFDENGKRKISDKLIEIAELKCDPEEAGVYADRIRSKAPKQSEALDILCCYGSLPTRELRQFADISRVTLKNLESKGLITFRNREVYRRPEIPFTEEEELPTLSAEQKTAYQSLSAQPAHSVSLLYGVTGSGKTSVYMHLIQDQLNAEKTAILLVPEIALTPQMLETFGARFGKNIAVLHSSLTAGERYDEWKRIKNGDARLIIGTRSAVFAPASNLGIIIIDEEQEESYKSENTPRYDTVDVARYICAKTDARLVLGSATPSLVSMYRAATGIYHLVRLESRFNDLTLPHTEIIDMKDEIRSGRSGVISSKLEEEMRVNIARGEQSILFLNRRGTNKLMTCVECGFVFNCPRCSVPLTFHSANNRFMCHHCGYSRRAEFLCPECGGQLKKIGAGTQQVEEEVKTLFPDISVLRVDMDTVAPSGSHEKLFRRFVEEKIPVMIGTQMVAKGLNFDNVTLVGVISADDSLYTGSYIAAEKTFDMITQVIGRSGRGEKPGRALIQTYTPKNAAIQDAARQDFTSFYENEIKVRSLQKAPPFMDVFSVTVTGESERSVLECCSTLKYELRDCFKDNQQIEVLGPIPHAIVKVNNRYRYKISISCKNEKNIRNGIAAVIRNQSKRKEFRKAAIYVTCNSDE